MRVLFLVPHLSTGGMPQFLLKRIQALQKYTDIEVFVFEFSQTATWYTVQRNQIIKAYQKIIFIVVVGLLNGQKKILKNNKI